MLRSSTYNSPLGGILLAEDNGGLAGLWFEGQKYFPISLAAESVRAETPLLLAAKRWLDRYFAGEQPSPGELCLTPAGGPFRQTIWQLLREIPYGAVTSYGALARAAAERLGRKTMSAQAVGGAVGHNPVSIVIPCHRVLGADGSLTGYAGGVEKKRWLLAHEGAERFVSEDGVLRRADRRDENGSGQL